MQMQMFLDKKEELEYKLDTRKTIYEKEETITCTSTANKTGTLSNQQENVVITDQLVPVEKTCHDNDQEKNEMLDKEDQDTSPLLSEYERKRKEQPSNCISQLYKRRQVQSPSLFSLQTSRQEVHLKGQQREVQISLPTSTKVETVSSKSSSGVKPKKKGQGRKSQALTGSSPRSVPRKRNKQSGNEEIEDGELDSRRWTYLPGKTENSPSIFDHAPKELNLVDTHIGYEESVRNFAKNLGPTAQSIASKKLKLLSLAQEKAPAFQAPVPRPSSACRISNDPKGKSVIIDSGIGRNSVSEQDRRPVGPFDRLATLSAGSAHIASFPDAYRIQKSADVVHRAVRENVHFPTRNNNRLVLQQQQQLQPPSNAAVTNFYTAHPGFQAPITSNAAVTNSYTGRPGFQAPIASNAAFTNSFTARPGFQVPIASNAAVTNFYSVRPGFQVPIAYEARPGTCGVVSRSPNLQPRQIACPSTTVRPSRLSTMCSSSGSGYGVWGGNQSTPLIGLQRHANPAALGQSFQQNLHNPLFQLQNQLGLQGRHRQQMEPQQQPLPLLRNMFDAGTSHPGTSFSAQDNQTTSNAARNRQQMPSARRTCPNLELQLRTKPPSPDEAV